jgi:hypothetical protein
MMMRESYGLPERQFERDPVADALAIQNDGGNP